jgi:prophage regulatory protein
MSNLAPHDLILRADLRQLVPLSDTTIWRMERRGEFPKRISISVGRIAWRRCEIEAWLALREAAREPAAA